jgi:hypothetical protein
MKTTLFKAAYWYCLLLLPLAGYAQTTPRYAASTQTWTFGEQIWSDAIHIPECNKTDFIERS